MIDFYYWPTPNGWKISILLEELGLRIRDIGQGPDGALYVLTAEDDGRLLRLTPSEQNDNVHLHTITHESNDYINE